MSTKKSLKEVLDKIYNEYNLKTTCPGNCFCCSVACPQMAYSEFLSLIDFIYNKLDKNFRNAIIKNSIRYFFSNSLVKPCSLLVDKRCVCYEDRPLSCRLYGIIPKEMFEKRVEGFIKNTGLKKEEIPLNTQCQYVKRVDNSIPLTEKMIEDLYAKINNLDMGVGNFTKQQIKKRYNQRTFHDWMMRFIFGEENLCGLTTFYLAAENKDVVDDFVKILCDKVSEM